MGVKSPGGLKGVWVKGVDLRVGRNRMDGSGTEAGGGKVKNRTFTKG